jgi:NAD-dependent SIR2 family protein deacetylase
MAYHPAKFADRLAAAGVAKADLEDIVKQWQYIARIPGERPSALPTPDPDDRPRKIPTSVSEVVPPDMYPPEKESAPKKKKAPPKSDAAPKTDKAPSKSGTTPNPKKALSSTSAKTVSKKREAPLSGAAPPPAKKHKTSSKPIPGKSAPHMRGAPAINLASLASPVVKKKFKRPVLKRLVRGSAKKSSANKTPPAAKKPSSCKSKLKKCEKVLRVFKHKLSACEKMDPHKVRKTLAQDIPRKYVVPKRGFFKPAETTEKSVFAKTKDPYQGMRDPIPGLWDEAEKINARAEKAAAAIAAGKPPPEAPTPRGIVSAKLARTVFDNMVDKFNNFYYGKLGLESVPQRLQKRVEDRVNEIMVFMLNPKNYRSAGDIRTPTQKFPELDLSGIDQRTWYDTAADVVLNSLHKVVQSLVDKGIDPKMFTEKELGAAAITLGKGQLFTMLVKMSDAAVMGEEEGAADTVENVYTPVKSIDPNTITLPITFLVGAGASRDSGIETFVDMSDSAKKLLNEMLVGAWSVVRKYSTDDQKAHAKKVRWSGDMHSYFFVKAPGEQLRHCLTTMAASYYPSMMLAAWEFMYLGVINKRPGFTHEIIKGLEDLSTPDAISNGEEVLGNVITMNVDGLEFAAGINDVAITPAHGSVLLKQPAGTKIGRATASVVRSLDEIRSGEFRPAIVLYGENVLPSAEDMAAVVQDSQDGTLVIVGASLSTGAALLAGMSVNTVVIVNPDPSAVADTIELVSESTIKDAEDEMEIEDDVEEDTTEDAIENFSTQNIYALRNPVEFGNLIDTVFVGFKVKKAQYTNRDPEVLKLIENRVNEYVKP